MNKLLIIGIASAVILFLIAMFTPAIQFASVFFGIAQSFLTCAVFYVVDRVGFNKIDTIAMLTKEPKIYFGYMCIYATLIMFSFYVSYGLFS